MSNTTNLNSLRGKITSAYLALVFVALVLGVIAWFDLMFLERQVTEGEVVSDLKDAVLEMRREEKNLFLYADQEALARAAEYSSTSLEILKNYHNTLGILLPETDLTTTTDSLITYRSLLDQWINSEHKDRKTLQDKIRILGHHINTIVDRLSTQERIMLQKATRKSQWFLLTSLLFIGIAIYVVGHLLKRVVLTPLLKLEKSLSLIARGEFDHLDQPSDDSEFVTFTQAFNRMLKELEIRRKRMLQSEKLASLGILASGVAHELNNPLSNISSSCQLLIEEINEADTEQLMIWLNQIDSETQRGSEIVRTLLDFGSQRVFKKTRVRLCNVIDNIKTIMGKSIREFNATLTINLDDGLEVSADKQRLQQLFINLIQNALTAGGHGVQIHISAMICDKGVSMIPEDAEVVGNLKCISSDHGRFVEIIVTDDGPGISSEHLSKVLDPFYTTSEPGKGVGLGLFIVQEIVNEHDGCLAITSRQGKGTQAIVLLPYQEDWSGTE